MKKIIILFVVLTACYSKEDAVKDISTNGGPPPYQCIKTGGGHSVTVVECRDGIGDHWVCSASDGCINFGKR